MTDNDNELLAIVNKFADYCACDEYHYSDIKGRQGNHDPKDGHMEFDEDKAIQALNRWRDAAVLEQMYEVNQMAITADVPEIYRVAITRRIQAIKARNGGDDE